MGFLGTAFRVLSGVARSFLGLPAAAAPVAAAVATGVPARLTAAAAATAARIARSRAARVGVGVAGGIVAGEVVSRAIPGGDGAAMAATGRGNGRFARQTIVETLDLMTGQVVRQQVLSGAPFLMASDVRKLEQTTKKLRRANARIPRRVVKESALAGLKDELVRGALSRSRGDKC